MFLKLSSEDIKGEPLHALDSDSRELMISKIWKGKIKIQSWVLPLY